MARCKDCINYDVCSTKGANCDRANHCEMFKDHNRFVELPCKVGDTIYEIKERKRNGEWKKVILERVVESFEIGKNGWISAVCGTTISVRLCDLNKTVFLTREEAERALKERENNV